MTTSRFSVMGLHLPDSEDPLGIWGMAESVTPGAVPFDAGADAADEGPTELVWRADLPALRSRAAADLQARLARARVRQANLEAAARQLERMGTGVSFAGQPSRAETALYAQVVALRGSLVAFGPEGPGPRSPVQLYEQCEELLARFRRLVQYYARVETSVGGRLIALSVVDWSGDYDVTWQDGVSEFDMALHLDAVRLALATRQAWLRLVSVVASGALTLSLKATVPGGQFLLIPAVYRYVRDVLAELEAVQVGTVS